MGEGHWFLPRDPTMEDCPGLIPCTPPPTPAPVGLTAIEVQNVNEIISWILIILFVTWIVAAFVIPGAFMFFVTRD